MGLGSSGCWGYGYGIRVEGPRVEGLKLRQNQMERNMGHELATGIMLWDYVM